jgi:hypothetical protein
LADAQSADALAFDTAMIPATQTANDRLADDQSAANTTVIAAAKVADDAIVNDATAYNTTVIPASQKAEDATSADALTEVKTTTAAAVTDANAQADASQANVVTSAAAIQTATDKLADNAKAELNADAGAVATLQQNFTSAILAFAVTMLQKPPAPAPAPVAATLDQVKAHLSLSQDGRALLKQANDAGMAIKVGATNSGGYYDPRGKVIVIDPKVMTDLNLGTSVLLFELLRSKHGQDELALDRKARTMTPNRFATECEKLSYAYIQEHHTIVNKAVKAGQWPKSVDDFDQRLTQSWSTFNGYLADAKRTGHYQVYINRYVAMPNP